MRSVSWIPIGLLLATSGCRVERTPPQYFDHQTTIEAEREAAAAELRDRLLAMGQALDRGNSTEALIALSPATDAYVVGPDSGAVVTGSEQIAAALSGLLEARAPVSAEIRNVEVGISARANVGWFRAELALPGHTPGNEPLRVTGVYVRDAGLWKLVQAHLSLPVSLQPADSTSSPSASAADSAGGGAAARGAPSRQGGT